MIDSAEREGANTVRFSSITISNFRGISHLHISNLGSMVVVAGPNGCGKSAALDAIRFLKSAYGGYQTNEVENWFGELQINPSRPSEFNKLLRRNDLPLAIEATIDLAPEERAYIYENAERLVLASQSGDMNNSAYDFIMRTLSFATDIHPDVQKRITEKASEIRDDLKSRSTFPLRLDITPDYMRTTLPSPTIELIFQTYDPHHLGVIDYYSASRSYARESLGSINLNLDALEQRQRQSVLYNWQNKYQNIKSDLASTYVREMISRQAGTRSTHSDLNETLKDLFRTFFPTKQYNGPVSNADGSVSFPVTLSTGESHDIDDLSSGEKEILYGYLRLRHAAPTNSVILLDEPELHLNPSLLRGFPDFYHRHLGNALGNQIWMTTHSDALLREAVRDRDFSVFHMRTPDASPAQNQAVPIKVENDVEQTIIDLVGDLATYQPQADIVIVEGDGLDKSILERLLPNFCRLVNIVSGGSKQRVRYLQRILSDATSQAGLRQKIFGIVDWDRSVDDPESENIYKWDRYHIENYLLYPAAIVAALQAVNLHPSLQTAEDVQQALHNCAEQIMTDIVFEEMAREVNKRLIGSVDLRSPKAGKASGRLRGSVERSLDKFQQASTDLLSSGSLERLEQQIEADFATALRTNEWMMVFPGRSILRRFVGNYVEGMSYDKFRDVVLKKMADDGFVPEGMSNVVTQIVGPQAR